ncbi:hypothetical protein ACFROC_29190 [Nocardia tengchongensis]|uniref:hypothetical protein n=1 Tax=Nocardia tengchongensis TaxID=2055889 RepID=UPI0036AF2EB8
MADTAPQGDALVDVTPETSAPLSRHFSAEPWRATAARRPKWQKIANPSPAAHCSECAVLQHETRGEFGPRMQPRARRTFAGDKASALVLCSRHAQAWRARDAVDAPAPRP